MAFPVLRFFRPQKLLFQASRRAIGSENVVRRRYQAEEVSTDRSQSRIKDSTFSNTNADISAPGVTQEPSEVHWALASVYKIGKRIPMYEGLQLSPSEQERAIPPWEPHNIPLKFRYGDGLRYVKL